MAILHAIALETSNLAGDCDADYDSLRKILLPHKAELSNLPAQTKLIPAGCKAELSSLSAQTKLMPSGYKTGSVK
ncbi:MAG: hypothetical protein WC001_11440 [Desulfurivibrionaceae bacterium]